MQDKHFQVLAKSASYIRETYEMGYKAQCFCLEVCPLRAIKGQALADFLAKPLVWISRIHWIIAKGIFS